MMFEKLLLEKQLFCIDIPFEKYYKITTKEKYLEL